MAARGEMSDRDPRPAPRDEPEPVDIGDSLRPAVARTSAAPGPWLLIGGAALIGLVVFLWLSAHRTHASRESAAPAPATVSVAVPPPPDLAQVEAAARGQVGALPPLPTVVTPPPAPLAVAAMTPARLVIDPTQRRKAPALVVDLSGEASPTAAGGLFPKLPGAEGSGAANALLNKDEQFAERVGAADAPERAKATMLRNQPFTIAQGVVIPAVLETALNSDLPGYTRAVVSRDVRGFDGSMVLIPRGSRLIGEYKSGLALGASRAFVIWTRVLRPDGASVQIGSSGTDPLGRAGLAGKVNRHFFERFGDAILLSVIDAGVTSLTSRPSTQIVIGSSQAAAGVASSVLTPTTISPTIKVPQGSPIRIFVVRDLDFSPVGGAQK